VNTAGIARLTTHPVRGVWYRAIDVEYLATPIACDHTATRPGRFNGGTPQHPGHPTPYLAESGVVAYYEVQAMIGSALPGAVSVPSPVPRTWVTLPIEVWLSRVVDLTLPIELQYLETSVQELTGDWIGYSFRPPQPVLAGPFYTNVPTQRLGHALHASPRRIEGLLTYSARAPIHRNLVVFPNRLRKGSFVRYTDPATGTVHQLPP
jgi:RES domain-containing protein